MTQLTVKNRNALPVTAFFSPARRKEPLEDASHTRSTIARFNQVIHVTAEERKKGWHRVMNAAKKFGMDVHDTTWRDLGKH